MQSIQAWAKANPQRLQEMLNANPSVVFFSLLTGTKGLLVR
jgi:membrane-bound lytic murein transglycosylase A